MYAFIAFIEQVVKLSSEDSWQWPAEGGGILWPSASTGSLCGDGQPIRQLVFKDT